jgi:aflatoxin B1 aldehyde reductase
VTGVLTCGSFLQIDWKSRGVVVDTKLIPGQYDGRDVKFTLPSLRKYIDIQLAAIKADSFPLWYLHAPDYSTPLEETVEAVKTLYEEGKFASWGLSNYAAWQVQKIVDIADKIGTPRPVAYRKFFLLSREGSHGLTLPYSCCRGHLQRPSPLGRS